jgi:vitamin K-dependent gamma-carboxylase
MTERTHVHPASLVAFRVLMGLVLFASTVRFLANGWVERFYLAPRFHFTYWGLDWVQPLPGWGMYAAFGLLAFLALCITVGFCYRAAVAAFLVLFTYVELIDVAMYLNHYYLVSLLCALMLVLPLHRAGSVDVLLRPGLRRDTLPAWALWCLRAQVGLVYVFAGVAKMGEDWLVHAQPLNLWLTSRVDLPLVGSHLDAWPVAAAMSWGGLLFDTTIVLWLLWKPTRPYAFAVLIGFHAVVGWLFPIGMFPFIMVVAATVFLAPDWPLRVRAALRRLPMPRSEAPRPFVAWPRVVTIAFCALLALQIAMPLRGALYGGDVLWHEQGMRWSWRVMVREKNGAVLYRVTLPDGREHHVTPTRYLTRHQEREMTGQPDLILALAHHIRDDYAERGVAPVEVRVDALSSLNGRAPSRLIDPSIDLCTVQDGLAPAPWVLPRPDVAPVKLGTKGDTWFAAF